MNRDIEHVLARVPWPDDKIEELRGIFAPAKVHLVKRQDETRIRDLLEYCDVAIIDGVLDDRFLNAPKLRWAHCDQSGLDQYAPQRLAESELIVTSSKGRSGPVLAEHALFFMLAHCQDARQMMRAQSRRVWGYRDQEKLRGLYGRKVCVVGYGATGGNLVKQCQVFNMEITVFRRQKLPADIAEVQHFSLEGGDRLIDAVRDADFTVMCASLNDDSYQMMGAPEIAAMKRGGALVNLARAQLVDETAMIEALKSGQLGGAGLDVAEPNEPLPPWHRLWSAPNVLISPHITPQMPSRIDRTLGILHDNADRFRQGKSLKHEFGPKDVFTRGARPDRFKGYHRIISAWNRIGRWLT